MTDRAEQKCLVHFAAVPPARVDVLRRALARARDLGAPAALSLDGPPERIPEDADVVVSLPWPVTDESQAAAALDAMRARKPVVVLETTMTAEWPALDPQSWKPRGFATEAPIVVSLDPRDEEHSLMLAIQRLSTDSELRTQLADAAHTWVGRQFSEGAQLRD